MMGWLFRLRIYSLLLLCLLLFEHCSTPSGEPAAKPDTDKQEPKSTIYTVEIAQMKFIPAEIKVKKGDQIVFINRDMVPHDVTEETAKKWTSSVLQSGEYWTLVASESSDYYCSIHTVMKGKVIVE
jgi:plastocyanin